MSPRALPDKLFFRIGEVADIVGVKPHVLRYWEREFGVLKPMKTRGSHRQYRRRDVELAMRIKQLLHDEGFTIAGAKKKMRELGEHRVGADLPDRAGREVHLRAALLGVREELMGLLAELDRFEDEARAEEEQPVEVTIHRAVPVPSRNRRG
ncbi:MAG: MerR family transcriptional regulator [Sandaracinaceae bacterium]|nr:MerR family transcriptional regulator [Sandaracinaceae bacterium]